MDLLIYERLELILLPTKNKRRRVSKRTGKGEKGERKKGT